MITPPRRGYDYVAAGDSGPMASAAPGKEIRNPRYGPPWLIVNHELAFVSVARWPGRLWQVELVEPAAENDQPHTAAKYTRAVAVRIERELPASMLFGPHGDAVCDVIDMAGMITLEQAARLSSARHPEAGKAYDSAFRTWLRNRGIKIQSWHDGFEHTLQFGFGDEQSPIQSGLSVVSGQVFGRAVAVAGDAAFEVDGEACWLVTPWREASAALLEAALARGAPDLVSEMDYRILTQAWNAVASDPLRQPDGEP